jgi:hypothetical protein
MRYPPRREGGRGLLAFTHPLTRLEVGDRCACTVMVLAREPTKTKTKRYKAVAPLGLQPPARKESSGLAGCAQHQTPIGRCLSMSIGSKTPTSAFWPMFCVYESVGTAARRGPRKPGWRDPQLLRASHAMFSCSHVLGERGVF